MLYNRGNLKELPMAENTLLEIRFAGGGVFPENIRAGEMAEILNAVEDTLSAVVEKEHPKITKEELLVGLVGIRKGSVHLQFSSQLPEVALPAFVKVAKSIKTKNFDDLPNNAIKSLQNFSTFVKRKNCDAEFITRNGKVKVLATFTPDIQIASFGSLRGDTTLYGQVVRVGGRDPR